MAAQDNAKVTTASKKTVGERVGAWNQEETQQLLILYKVIGAHWSRIARAFGGRAVNDVKNRFYTTLRRAATRAHLEDPNRFHLELLKCKKNLVQFVDAAILYGGSLSSKRGRKKKTEVTLVRTQGPSFSPARQTTSPAYEHLVHPPRCPVQASTRPLQPLPAFPAWRSEVSFPSLQAIAPGPTIPLLPFFPGMLSPFSTLHPAPDRLVTPQLTFVTFGGSNGVQPLPLVDRMYFACAHANVTGQPRRLPNTVVPPTLNPN